MKALLVGTMVWASVASAETLHYSINWQSGLNLGEATLGASKTTSSGPEGIWDFTLTLDAAVPGFTIRDEYKSTADGRFCTSLLEKTVTRGSRKSSEKDTFDQSRKTVERATSGGGKSQVQTSGDCAHDAMAFLQFARQELAQGRLATNQAVYLGGKYDVQLTYTGTESIKQEKGMVETDKVRVSIHGAKADTTFEILFARDEVRTPLMARLPLALGTFTVELQP